MPFQTTSTWGATRWASRRRAKWAEGAVTASADAAELRPFDRLPDNELAKVLAVLKQSEHRRVESVSQRWRQIRPRASLARVKSLRFRGRHVMFVARRFRNGQEDYYSTDVRFSNVGVGRKELLILDGTGDDFVISTMHEGSKRFLRMHPGTGVCKPPNHQVLTEDRAQATHFEAVETLFHGQREYYTLPNYVYFRLKGTQSFLKSTRVGADRRAPSRPGHASPEQAAQRGARIQNPPRLTYLVSMFY